jgi:c-di-GMP-binding flagellar brake protein YcgR
VTAGAFDRDGEQMTGEKQDIQLQVNDQVQVKIKGTDKEVPTTFLSRVEDAAPGDYLIAWPSSNGLPAPIKDREVLLMSFTNQGSAYCLEAIVMRRVQNPIPLLTVWPLGPVRRIQRREYVRVPATINVELAARVINASVNGREPVSQALIETETVNISGGGFAIRHLSTLPLGALFDVKLKIPEQGKALNVTAKVVRSEPLAAPTSIHTHEIGFAFCELAEAIRCQIMSFVIRLQQSSLVRV